MINPTIEVRLNNLPKITAALTPSVAAEIQRAAFQCEALAKSLAPVDTGLLRNSIQAEEEGQLSWIVGPHTDYAAHVEFGTHRMPARPYLTPAVEQVRPHFMQRMNQVVEESAR